MHRLLGALFLLALDHLCDLCAVILFSLLDTSTLVETNIAVAKKLKRASYSAR